MALLCGAFEAITVLAGFNDVRLICDAVDQRFAETCVGNDFCPLRKRQVRKVYCYFEASLSFWVVKKGLFWRCYDEFITWSRCSRRHKRGHIGSIDVCRRPYQNQEAQNDEEVGVAP